MLLYHFTIGRYADSIREHGILSTGEKMRRGMYPADWAPPPSMFPMENELVWLTRHPEAYAGVQRPEQFNDLISGRVKRSAGGYASEGEWQPVRVAVEVEARAWRTAHPRYGVPPIWLRAMRVAGRQMGEDNFDRDWYVVEGSVPPQAIIAVDYL